MKKHIKNEADYNAGFEAGNKTARKAVRAMIRRALKQDFWGPTTREDVLRMILKKI